MKEQLKHIRNSVAGSYSQVFFSDNRWLALFLLPASFIDPYVGLSGFASVMFAVLLAGRLGLNPLYIRNGTYTYNVLLSGLAMGAYFKFTGPYVLMLLVTALLTLFITIWLSGITARHKLPFLSLPFIISLWIVFFSARSFHAGFLTDRNIYQCDGFCSGLLSSVSHNLELAGLPKLLFIYLKAMGGIFFQTNIIAGVLVTMGLLIYSRIAFSLSWLGFLSGYVFFRFTYGPLPAADYGGISFNYIFSALALAGFYLVPSLWSYLLVIVATPVIALFTSALAKVVAPYYLPLFSMPFSLAVILIIAVLNNRYYLKYIYLVQYQLYSPEKNLYAYHTYMERFKKDTFIHIHLPFYGEWTVSQGHAGSLTHKGNYSFAWDFVVTDEHKRTFRPPGRSVSDFYCYGLPVLAPADGTVVTVEDGVDENAVGDVNLAENWGNTIVIKHSDYLYSKISHIKKDSFKVKEGDYVKKGDMLALCGSSGRSPEPHIHFQLQATPYIAARTMQYPVSYYIVKKADGYKLRSFESPAEGEVILKPMATPLLKKAFHFIPGMKLSFLLHNGPSKHTEHWEVLTDSLNNSYLQCARTGSTAYFTNNDTLFYFTGFSGDKTSLLYYFYLAAYKVVLSYLPGIAVEDKLPVETYYNGLLRPLQDLIAPFYIFMKPVFTSTFAGVDNTLSPDRITIASQAGTAGRQLSFETELSAGKIKKITVKGNDLWLTAENIT